MISRRALLAGATLLAAPAVVRAAKPRMVITGDMGNVGSRLAFLAEQFDAVGIDKKRGPHQDLLEPRTGIIPWSRTVRRADVVLHLAWNMLADRDQSQNITLTKNLLGATKAGTRFIFASSAQVDPFRYGHLESKACETSCVMTISEYGRAKINIEDRLRGPVDGSVRVAIRFGHVHHASNAPPPPGVRISGYGPEIDMKDSDLRGLMKLALEATEFKIIGPFDAR